MTKTLKIYDLAISNDKVYINSLKLAEVFEKRHADLMRAIKALPQDNFRKRNFAFSFYTRETGNGTIKKYPYYNLTRDAFALLVMGFTGEKAYQWKVEFIKAFNLMEEKIKNLA
ncbi:Rha family transcriptional regulator [Campylobacter sp. MIT 97-5078]|uniref:Rha family transcriptional regulator n=1 Tax=Campylobacter sp. MIT 97-5078 TaxID=1548153 RepID=UPI00068F8635|nr:Rha family transcriptional regulator [Campylobacter sp. MIT 97-5078]TQR23056.1 hypothetical protein DMB91_08460 [Campylobacter sp. MIT 97-5078]